MKKSTILSKNKLKTEIFEDFRVKKGLSKKDFCSKCGISVTTYNKILSKEYDILLGTLFKLLKTTQIHLIQLF